MTEPWFETKEDRDATIQPSETYWEGDRMENRETAFEQRHHVILQGREAGAVSNTRFYRQAKVKYTFSKITNQVSRPS